MHIVFLLQETNYICRAALKKKKNIRESHICDINYS